jgi:hypothetical protein
MDGIAVALATMRASRLTVDQVVTLFRDEMVGSEWHDALGALARFATIYGRPFSIGASPLKTFFFDETYPLPGLQSGALPFSIPGASPQQRFLAKVVARQSSMGFVVVKIGFVVDYGKYDAALKRRRFHAPQRWPVG